MELKTEEVNIQEEVRNQLSKLNVPVSIELSGLAVFLIIFVIIVPYLLLKLNDNFIMLYYFSNLDLIANVLNHWDNFFDNLYYPNPLSEYSFFSSTLINFIALLGVSAMVGKIALQYKSVFYGVASATTVLSITYLLSSTIVYLLMVNVDERLKKYYSNELSNNLAVLSGVVVSFIIVVIEVVLSQKYIGPIAGAYEKIYNNVKHLI